ncbi:MAG: hypothetical protein ACYC9J_03575 [Sulfuricaulis sp.]
MSFSRLWLVATLAVSVFLNGCANPFVAVKPDTDTGKFPSRELSPDEIKTFVKIDNLGKQKFILLIDDINVSWEWTKNYRSYVKEMLENCGLGNFMAKTQLENFVIANNLGEKIPSLSDRIGYHQLAKYIGPYLIVSVDLENWRGTDIWEFGITVYDPVSSSTKFAASRRGVNDFGGMDKLILLPAFNSLKKWVDESQSPQKNPAVKGNGI